MKSAILGLILLSLTAAGNSSVDCVELTLSLPRIPSQEEASNWYDRCEPTIKSLQFFALQDSDLRLARTILDIAQIYASDDIIVGISGLVNFIYDSYYYAALTIQIPYDQAIQCALNYLYFSNDAIRGIVNDDKSSYGFSLLLLLRDLIQVQKVCPDPSEARINEIIDFVKPSRQFVQLSDDSSEFLCAVYSGRSLIDFLLAQNYSSDPDKLAVYLKFAGLLSDFYENYKACSNLK